MFIMLQTCPSWCPWPCTPTTWPAWRRMSSLNCPGSRVSGWSTTSWSVTVDCPGYWTMRHWHHWPGAQHPTHWLAGELSNWRNTSWSVGLTSPGQMTPVCPPVMLCPPSVQLSASVQRALWTAETEVCLLSLTIFLLIWQKCECFNSAFRVLI